MCLQPALPIKPACTLSFLKSIATPEDVIAVGLPETSLARGVCGLAFYPLPVKLVSDPSGSGPSSWIDSAAGSLLQAFKEQCM